LLPWAKRFPLGVAPCLFAEDLVAESGVVGWAEWGASVGAEARVVIVGTGPARVAFPEAAEELTVAAELGEEPTFPDFVRADCD